MEQGKKMQVKGSSILAVPAFVKTKYPDRYDEWVNALSPEAKSIQKDAILATNLYPLYYAMVEPTQKLCDLFYNGGTCGAWESGKFSASYAQKGIYKFFFKVGSPQFIIERAARVFTSYYPEGELQVSESSSHRVVLQITKFPEPYRILDYDMAGWMDGTLELLKCSQGKVEIAKSMAEGDAVTEFVATWV
ncbi:MAG: hypothetical protein R6V04_13355 [bacterium]